MDCDKCGAEFELTGTTTEYPDCNTWTCPTCGYVRPEMGSLRLADAARSAHDSRKRIDAALNAEVERDARGFSVADSDKRLLVAFIQWWKGYRAEFCAWPTPDDADAFLATRQEQARKQADAVPGVNTPPAPKPEMSSGS